LGGEEGGEVEEEEKMDPLVKPEDDRVWVAKIDDIYGLSRSMMV
jgi:hypothetical protein